MLQNSLLLKGVSLMYNFVDYFSRQYGRCATKFLIVEGCFVDCLGFELVHFQGLLSEASGDLFFHYSLRGLTISGPLILKPNRPLAVFPLTVGVNH